jgi:hypothetical protein
MPALVAGIHVFPMAGDEKAWMAGSKPAMTAGSAVVVMTWLNYMQSVVLHGLDFAGPYAALQTSAQIFAFSLMGASAIALAARNRRAGLAILLVSTPTLFNLVDAMAFFVALTIHGF